MKLNNFKEVQALVTKLNLLDKAIDKIENLVENEEQQFEAEQYHCCIAQHVDGSGKQINMTGCGVWSDIIRAALIVLLAKRDEVKNHLEALNVDTGS